MVGRRVTLLDIVEVEKVKTGGAESAQAS
jgi:hypothetical protein